MYEEAGFDNVRRNENGMNVPIDRFEELIRPRTEVASGVSASRLVLMGYGRKKPLLQADLLSLLYLGYLAESSTSESPGYLNRVLSPES